MKEYLGQTCKILIQLNDKELFYYAKIISINQTHISFLDKYGKLYTYKKDLIKEIHN